MNNKKLYESIMRSVAKTVKNTLNEMVEIPENEVHASEFEVNDVIKMCLAQLQSDGGIYLDWGITGDMYKNVNTQELAEEVAEKFLEKGYYVYYQGAGQGLKNIIPGTPVAIRICKRPVPLSKYDTPFD